jgi:hypothetical protein
MNEETSTVRADLKSLIERELAVFPSDEMRIAFRAITTIPYPITKRWIYGDDLHTCWVVAEDSDRQIVHCETGFGPEFPWSAQPRNSTNMGMDGEWCAYLFEAFAPSGMWKGEVPPDFMLMGPGERS